MMITILAYKPESVDICMGCQVGSYSSDFQWKSSPDYGVVAEFLAVITFNNMIRNINEDGYLVTVLFDGEPSEDAGTAAILVEIYKAAQILAQVKYTNYLKENESKKQQQEQKEQARKEQCDRALLAELQSKYGQGETK